MVFGTCDALVIIVQFSIDDIISSLLPVLGAGDPDLTIFILALAAFGRAAQTCLSIAHRQSSIALRKNIEAGSDQRYSNILSLLWLG